MPTAFTSVQIAQSSKKSVSRDVISVKLGNGYEQRIPNGINYVRDKWTVNWEGLNSADFSLVTSFLNSVSDGSTILWTTPLDSVQKKFVLDGDYTIDSTSGGTYNVSCNLVQVFDLT